uniref:YihY/virulence factor BrkB family protein n=1 Tax=Pseudactinotalea sp. HY158 TaxID=2654547 RepID=UPI00129D0EB3|nr:YhjD/YihY/BrkB family envelope integrity protein [Pseudactinotalea sp. HY158]QGH70316.1 YihY/virulence factor BrkB family protein [Pseudactinotalea sp. HY158]
MRRARTGGAGGEQEPRATDRPGRSVLAGMIERLKIAAARAESWWRDTRIARALARYSAGNGAQLSGGIALGGLLSVAAALTIALTALVGVFREHPGFAQTVFAQIDQVLPGVIDTGSGTGLVTPDQLVLATGWGVAGIIAVLVLLNSATVVMAALRTALRAMFGLRKTGENFLFGKLRDLLGFIGLAVSVLTTSFLAVVTQVAFGWLERHVGWLMNESGSRLGLDVATIAVSFFVDASVFAVLFRGLAGARVPWARLWQGCALGAVGTGALRLLGASVVANVSGRPLLGSVAAVAALATLLIWLNLAARLALLVAAWTADPPARPKLDRKALVNVDHTPNYVSVVAPETLDWTFDTYTGIVAIEQRPREPEPEPAPVGFFARVRQLMRERGR